MSDQSAYQQLGQAVSHATDGPPASSSDLNPSPIQHQRNEQPQTLSRSPSHAADHTSVPLLATSTSANAIEASSSSSTAAHTHQPGFQHPEEEQKPKKTNRAAQLTSKPNLAGNERLKSQRGSALQMLLPGLAVAALGAVLWWWKHRESSANEKHRPSKTKQAREARMAATPSKSGAKQKKGSKHARQATSSATAASQEPSMPEADKEHMGASAKAAAETAPPPEPIEPDTFNPIVSDIELLPPANPPVPLPLQGLTCAVSEDLDVQGNLTTFGVAEWQPHASQASGTAPAISRAVTAGASCRVRAAMQPAGLDLIGATYGNHLNKTRVSGGGHTGSALAVALEKADFAICTDSLGQARIPAACSSIYCYRPSTGVFGGATEAALPGSPAASSQLLNTVSVITRDAGLSLKVAQVLGAPGSANIKGEILQFVVAQDLFDMCAPELQPAILAVKKAIIKWAGSDQAGAVQLVQFLSRHVHSWGKLIPGEKLAAGYEAVNGGGIKMDAFLEAAVVAAQILQAEELHQRAGALEAAASPPTSPDVGADKSAEQNAVTEPSDATSAEGGVSAAAEQQQQHEGTQTGNQTASETSRAGQESNKTGEQALDVASENTQQDSKPEPPAGTETTETAPETNDLRSTDEATVITTDADNKPTAQAEASSAGDEAAVRPAGVLPARPSAEQLSAARQVAAEIQDCLKSTVKPDTMMILPALPFPPPKRKAASDEMIMFTKLTQCFHALASLGACPTLVAPVGLLRDGSPVAISIMAVNRFDQRLLAVAQKLCPMVQESFLQVKEEITQMAKKNECWRSIRQRGRRHRLKRQRHWGQASLAYREQSQARETESGAAAAADAAPGKKSAAQSQPSPNKTSPAVVSNGKANGTSKPAPPAPTTDPKKAEKAEKAKSKGNDLYLAGKHLEAMNEYTKAIALNPGCHVYYSNRAMACIKLFRFEQAEEDCNRTLSFELSDKDKVKALLRRATARDALQKYEGAESDLKAVLRIEPNNKQAREDIQVLRQHQAQMARSQADMVAQLRAQQQQQVQPGAGLPAAGGLPAGLPPGIDPSMLPPGFDPSMLPPGFFGPEAEAAFEQMAAAAGGGYYEDAAGY